jgi:exopolyphosphatase/guanosine-5'-triphosphate,3'-diphosphate pyrophosphatase
MGTIIARWEWRTFGQEFGIAASRFAALEAGQVQQSAETYLLTDTSDANVKIRNELLDIKILEHVDQNGLEQWRPVLKETFPLGDPAIAQLRGVLGLQRGALRPGRLSLDQLLADLASAARNVHVIGVRKTRTRYDVHGCTGEVTEVEADGQTARTIAIEDADSAKVIAVVRAMGLERYPNTSYPRGLKQLVGLSLGAASS